VESFDVLWKGTLPELRKRCRALTRNDAAAEELLAETAQRVWRGFPTFRGDSLFSTWVFRIAEREAVRLGVRDQRRRSREIPLDPVVHDRPGSTPAHEPAVAGLPGLAALRCAVACGDLSVVESRIVVLHATRHRATWAELGEELGLSATACAVAHCRAIPKLRVHLLTHHLDELGAARVRAALQAAAAADPPLPPAAVEAFDVLVLRGRADYRRRGWRTALRTAATAVFARLDIEEMSADR